MHLPKPPVRGCGLSGLRSVLRVRMRIAKGEIPEGEA